LAKPKITILMKLVKGDSTYAADCVVEPNGNCHQR
jgi:hypothetical protein